MEQNDKSKRPDNVSDSAETELDIPALQYKWGVSADEIHAAMKKVGNKRSSIEEYLVNNRWERNHTDQTSFQKRDLNEDETY